MIFPFVGWLGGYCTGVATVIEYPIALKALEQRGLVCNYFNGGAFGFPKGVDVSILGWIAADDPSIRPLLRPYLRVIPPPAEEKMAKAAIDALDSEIPGPLWIMPLSHWAFELDFGSKTWLGQLVQSVGQDPQLLAARSDASPLEFNNKDLSDLVRFIRVLLENLTSSDFMLASPIYPVLCTIHHHKQLWWTSSNEPLLEEIGTYTPT
jgi:hypothetical protein